MAQYITDINLFKHKRGLKYSPNFKNLILLKQKYTNMKNYKLTDILPVTNFNDWQSKQIQETKEQADKINALYPCEILLYFSEHEGQEYYERADIKMTYQGHEFFIRYWEHKKKYVIYETFTQSLKNVDRYALSKIKETIQEPQQIGVLSTKKLLNWFEYHLAVIQEAKKIDAQNGNTKEAFLKSIEGLPVHWYNEGKHGEIIQNGIKFSFTIGETYISKKIEVHYQVSNEIDTFLKLADNKY